MKKKPIIGISTNEIVNFNGRQISHSTGQRYVESVMKFSDVIPILIPSFLNQENIEILMIFECDSAFVIPLLSTLIFLFLTISRDETCSIVSLNSLDLSVNNPDPSRNAVSR